jgi:hypothetical protein
MTNEDIKGLKKFARDMISSSWEGYDISGADVQDIALKCGLLYEDTATEADVDRSEYSTSGVEVGDTIYRLSPFMLASSAGD